MDLTSFFLVFLCCFLYFSTVALSLRPEQYNLYGAAPIYIEFILYMFLYNIFPSSLSFIPPSRSPRVSFLYFLFFAPLNDVAIEFGLRQPARLSLPVLLGLCARPCVLFCSFFKSRWDLTSMRTRKPTRPTLCRLELLTKLFSHDYSSTSNGIRWWAASTARACSKIDEKK